MHFIVDTSHSLWEYACMVDPHTTDTREHMMTKKPDWYDIGYADAKADRPCRVPENYSARMSYLRGFDAGQTDGPAHDPFLSR